MLIADVKKLSPMDRLLYWVKERYSIFTKKEAKSPKPWTDDTILQSCYFTNVYREFDKVTRWYAENIREPLEDEPEVIFATIAFRWFNHIPTGNWLLEDCYLVDWNTAAVVQMLTEIAEEGGQIFTGAFNISNSGSTKPKINRVCEDYIEPVWKDSSSLRQYFQGCNKTLAQAHKFLMQYPGLGGSGFMAAQVIADLKYTSFLKDAPDWDTWCCLGPGSKRGLNRVLGRQVDDPIPKNWDIAIQAVRERLDSLGLPEFHAQDTQNCLCEYDKYSRVLFGEGQSKRRYNGKT